MRYSTVFRPQLVIPQMKLNHKNNNHLHELNYIDAIYSFWCIQKGCSIKRRATGWLDKITTCTSQNMQMSGKTLRKPARFFFYDFAQYRLNHRNLIATITYLIELIQSRNHKFPALWITLYTSVWFETMFHMGNLCRLMTRVFSTSSFPCLC